MSDLTTTERIEELAQALAAAEETIVHKDNRITELEADLADERDDADNWCENFASIQRSLGDRWKEIKELKAEIRGLQKECSLRG